MDHILDHIQRRVGVPLFEAILFTLGCKKKGENRPFRLGAFKSILTYAQMSPASKTRIKIGCLQAGRSPLHLGKKSFARFS